MRSFAGVCFWPGLRRVLLLLLALSQLAGAAFFSTQGTEIVDTTGTPVQLRGVGLGGWLVPEGYMLHIPGYGSPSYIDSLVTDLIGPSNRQQFWQAYRDNYVNRADIEKIAEWGFNSIRLPFHYRLFYDPDSGGFVQEGFRRVDSLLSWCKPAGLFIILDMHCAPGGQNKDNISDSDGIEARLWTDSNNRLLTCKIWKRIAETYRDEPQIIGYDLLNEPVLPNGYPNSFLRDFYVQLRDTIRQVDTNHLLFIEGNWYATDFNQLTPPFDSKMAYSFHKYWNPTSVGTIQYLLDIRSQFNVPLWMGESGENSNHWFYSAVRLLEQQQVGWCWWTHKKVETLTSPLSARMNPDYQTVLDYWRGNAPRPSLYRALSALMGLAEDLKIERCEGRPGVVRALMDPDFGNQSQPYRPHSIPGNIAAVEYDFGTQGGGYSDADFQNVNGPGGTAWNQGWQFRNDGVDIEACADTTYAEYNVGWMESGEWLKYTVTVTHSSNYRVRCRVAAPNSGGRLSFYWDEQPIGGTVHIPATGGWQNWQTVDAGEWPLEAGIHTLYISVAHGGFNLSTIRFEAVTGIEDSGNSPAENFQLLPNYPNPFNPTTTIRVIMPGRGRLNLAMFNLLGQKIRTIFEGELSAGEKTFTINAADLPAGIYFCVAKFGQRQQKIKMVLLK